MSGRKREEVCIYNKYTEVDLVLKVRPSVCKISYKILNSKKQKSATGFFILLFPQDSFRCLITNYHVISEELEDKYIELELCNKKVVKLLLDKNSRIISFFKRPKDITVIQINDQDIDIIENVDFLNYDMNYLNGYDIYEK